MSKINFDEVKEKYKQYYQEAISAGRTFLPYYEIQPWDSVLNEVELRTFQDIRYMGVPLYPVFPISETGYLHFANPFLQIGIEIIYKNSPSGLINRKIELLKAEGWTIYTIKSKETYHTIEEYFRIRRKTKELEWEDLPDTVQYRFVEKFHKENAACLLQFIQWKHFQDLHKLSF